MDLLQGVQDAVREGEEAKNVAENNEEITMDKIVNIIDQLNLSDEGKRELRESLLEKGNMDKLSAKLAGMAGGNINNAGAVESHNFVVLFLLVGFILLVLVFFGYKLYKAHVERERRKEEKRRLRQQKKKK